MSLVKINSCEGFIVSLKTLASCLFFLILHDKNAKKLKRKTTCKNFLIINEKIFLIYAWMSMQIPRSGNFLYAVLDQVYFGIFVLQLVGGRLWIGSQQTFQRRFNVAFRLIWRRDVAQRQINVETTLHTSTLKSTTFNNVETTLCISTLNWTTLDNVETTSFSTLIFTTLGNVKTTLRIWPFQKKNK